jgi:hypothetical protein
MPWPGDIESVTITWENGEQETFPCNTVRVENGELHLSSVYKSGLGFGDQVKDERSIPLAGFRSRVVNRVV